MGRSINQSCILDRADSQNWFDRLSLCRYRVKVAEIVQEQIETRVIVRKPINMEINVQPL